MASSASTQPGAAAANAPAEAEVTEQGIVVDEDDSVSAFESGNDASETTSIASSIARGRIVNGRKGPSDQQQYETMDAGHTLYLVLDSDRSNPLFRSPITEPKNILDLGTGPGTWAVDVADQFPTANVYGVDLAPPVNTWLPPNCNLQVDDALSEWTWRVKFDLIHMRLMLGAFTDTEWDDIYQKCFDNLEPGGYIEQLEPDVQVMSDDGSLKPSSLLAGWGDNFVGSSERAGRSLDTHKTMKAKIEAAGFVDVQEHLYKCPIGIWPKDKLLKDAGRINHVHWSSGLEGFAMFLLTRFGAPKPWTADEVRAYTSKVREELKAPNLHIWHYTRRVWGRKP